MPRAGLTTKRVVAEAATLADEVGYDGLTLTRLAERVGVAVPSLYKHVDSLEALRLGVARLALEELGEAMRVAVADVGPEPSRSRVLALAATYRAFASRHPGRYTATIRAAPASHPDLARVADEALQPALAVLAELGLAGDDLIHAARALRASIHGFVALEAAQGFGLPQEIDRSFARMVEALERGLRPN